MGELNVATILPGDVERCDAVINRAIDVRTACMVYLAYNICDDATPLGTFGNISTLFRIFKGDEQITEAKSYLKSSIDSYNNALVNINLRIVVKVYELLKGTYFDVSLRYFD